MASVEIPIPWATKTKAFVEDTRTEVVSIDLKSDDGTEVSIDRYGDVELTLNSKKIANDTLSYSDKLTRSLRRFFKKGIWETPSLFIEGTKAWLFGKDDSPLIVSQPGILDWWPGDKKIGKQGPYQSGRAGDISDSWSGMSFKYVHFVMPDKEEGIVVRWDDEYDTKPEVWVGYVDEFVSMNIEDWDDLYTYGSYNGFFENGFLWALDVMGVFEGKVIKSPSWSYEIRTLEIPEWAVFIIDEDPDLLWPELVDKLIKRFGEIPEKLETAVRTWIDRRRAETEETTGQQYFWPKGGQHGEEEVDTGPAHD